MFGKACSNVSTLIFASTPSSYYNHKIRGGLGEQTFSIHIYLAITFQCCCKTLPYTSGGLSFGKGFFTRHKNTKIIIVNQFSLTWLIIVLKTLLTQDNNPNKGVFTLGKNRDSSVESLNTRLTIYDLNLVIMKILV